MVCGISALVFRCCCWGLFPIPATNANPFQPRYPPFLRSPRFVVVPASFFLTAYLVRWLKETDHLPAHRICNLTVKKGDHDAGAGCYFREGWPCFFSISIVTVFRFFITPRNRMPIIVGLVMAVTPGIHWLAVWGDALLFSELADSADWMLHILWPERP